MSYRISGSLCALLLIGSIIFVALNGFNVFNVLTTVLLASSTVGLIVPSAIQGEGIWDILSGVFEGLLDGVLDILSAIGEFFAFLGDIIGSLFDF